VREGGVEKEVKWAWQNTNPGRDSDDDRYDEDEEELESEEDDEEAGLSDIGDYVVEIGAERLLEN
jgi:hypothetical protein